MKRKHTLYALMLICAIACTGKVKPEGPIPDKNENEEPGEVVTPEEPEEPEEPKFKEVSLHEAFRESFDGKTSEIFNFDRRETGNDFRYYPAFPSWNENKTTLLMMRVDPKDAAGLIGAPSISTKEHCFYGSYSIRMRLPDIKSVQQNIGLNAVFTLSEQDEKNGYSTIELMWKLADPNLLYLNTIADLERYSDRQRDPVSNFKPSGAYYTYGFDWHADKVTWWIMEGTEKKTVKESTKAVPLYPSVLKFVLYHSKNNPVESNPNATIAPAYPYEFEIDAIAYEPYEDEIKAWHDANFKD